MISGRDKKRSVRPRIVLHYTLHFLEKISDQPKLTKAKMLLLYKGDKDY